MAHVKNVTRRMTIIMYADGIRLQRLEKKKMKNKKKRGLWRKSRPISRAMRRRRHRDEEYNDEHECQHEGAE